MLTFGNTPVPWTVGWTGEESFFVGPCRHADGRRAICQGVAPGIGKPTFGKPHSQRQRQCIAEGRCDLCGKPLKLATKVSLSHARPVGHGAAGKLIVVNLFAFRATKPKVLLAENEPIGPENNDHIQCAAEEAHNSGGMVIAAWGAHGGHRDRDKQVMALLDAWDIFPKSLAETAGGMPRHPLYLPSNCKPLDYAGRDA